jgi:hypothetical protein
MLRRPISLSALRHQSGFKRKHTTRIYLAALAATFIIAEAAFAATGAAYLKIPNGPVEIALGQTGVSYAEGGSAVWWNPALIASGNRGLSLQAFHWLADGQGTFGAGSFKTSWGGLGAYFFDLGMPGFEARERPGPADGTFALHQSVLAVAGAANLPFNLNVGAALKATMDDVFGDYAYNYPVLDAGVTWKKGDLAAGLAGSNIALSHRRPEELPRTLRAGASYKRHFGDFSLLGTTEFAAIRGIPPTIHAGVEAGWRDGFFLRGGWMGGSGVSRPSFGVGVVTGPYSIDAATTLYDPALGSSWRIGLGMTL